MLPAAFIAGQLWPGSHWMPDARWPDVLLLVLVVAATLTALARELPLQNVLLSATIILLLSSVIEILGMLTPLPIGLHVYQGSMEQSLGWGTGPMVWLALLLNGRAVARRLLRHEEPGPNHGFRVLAVAALLVSLFTLGLQPFAMTRGYWGWGSTTIGLEWHHAPWVAFLGRGVAAGLALALTLPLLICKKPGQADFDGSPLYLWIGLNGLMALNAATHRLWLVLALIVIPTTVVCLLAWAHWPPTRRSPIKLL